MIENLIEAGSTLFWVLLFFGIYITTALADRRTSLLLPSIAALSTLIMAFGFTNYRPEEPVFAMSVIAYLMIGMVFSVSKWMLLVNEIRNFVRLINPLTDDWTKRHLAYQKFKPADTDDETLSLPPHPDEFRTRISLWFLFWPSFMLLRFLTIFHKKLGKVVWSKLYRMSVEIYEDQDRPPG